jgi:hypothetical protein
MQSAMRLAICVMAVIGPFSTRMMVRSFSSRVEPSSVSPVAQ